MAAPTGSLLSLGHFNSTQQNDFVKQKERYAKKSRETHLKQQWQELEERERTAQQHNRELLQQFEEAQHTLKEMLARNAAMKTIRMEYERYLEENVPRWQQQLQEKTQVAEKKKMEDYLRSYLKKTEQERTSKSTAGASTRPPKNSSQTHSNQEYSDYSQDKPQYPLLQSSWLTHTQSQTGRFPVRGPAQTHSPTILSQPNFPHPHPFIHHLASMEGHSHPQFRQDAAFWGPSEHNYLRSWAAGMPPGSWNQLYTEEPPFESRVWQTGKQEDEISRAPSSKRERAGRSSSSRLSPELDVKPVRLPSAHAESSESGSVTSSQEKRKKREKRGRTQDLSSDSERCSSQGSSKTSSEIVIAPVAVPQISVTETSTEEESTRSSRRSKRSGGLTAGSPRSEKAMKEQTRNHNEESQSTSEASGNSSEDSMKEEVGNQSDDENTESCREEQESGSDSVKNENGFKGEAEKQENNSSEQSSAEENEEERKHLGAGDEENDKKEDSEKSESDDVENDENVSAKTNTTGEEETAGEDEDDQGDDEEPDKLENKDAESRKPGSASSQDEDEDGGEGNESKIDDEEGSNDEDDGESEEEEEHRSEKGEENRDSEDSIISPQEKRSKQMQIIPEDAAEDEEDDEECKDGSSTDDSNEVSDEDDVENLLAPQDHSKTEEKNGKADEKPKAICHMDIFQVTDVRPKTDHHSDSDEFDHFYD